MARLNRKPGDGVDEPGVAAERADVAAPAERGDAGQAARRNGRDRKAGDIAPVKRSAAAPSRPSLRLSPLLGAMSPDLVETFHYLVARLQLNPEAMISPIAVVAATHGEGVTTVTRALGAVLANDLDARVCIVDLSTPISANQKDAATRLGLFDVVDQDLPLSEALRTTADERLLVLGSGVGSPAQARQLMRSSVIGKVFEELGAMFDYVLIDVPPILAGSSGVSMLRYANSYLMVVRHGHTPVAQVRAVADELQSINSIGVVLNQVSSRIPKRLRRFFSS